MKCRRAEVEFLGGEPNRISSVVERQIPNLYVVGSIPTSGAMDIIVSDFDDTLFKRNHGLIEPMVKYLEQRNLPVYIVTYRAQNQLDFIRETLGGRLNIIGYGFAESRKKEAYKKIEIINVIRSVYNVVEILDDDKAVASALGFDSRIPN